MVDSGGGGGGGGGGSGGSSYASATDAWEPDCTSQGVRGGGRTGGGRGSSPMILHISPQYPYPPAPHRSRASARLDPDPLLLSCFYGRQEYKSTQTRLGPFSTLSLRPEAIQAPNFKSHAACRHDRFLRGDLASWPNPGDHRWLFGCPLKARRPSFFPFPSLAKSCQAWSSEVSNFKIIGLVAEGQSHRRFFPLTTQRWTA